MNVKMYWRILLSIFCFALGFSLPASAQMAEESKRLHFPNGGSLAALIAQQTCNVPLNNFLRSRQARSPDQMQLCGDPVNQLIILYIAARLPWSQVEQVISSALSENNSRGELGDAIRENPDRARLALTMAAAESGEYVQQASGNSESNAANADVVSLTCPANENECEAPSGSANALQQRNFPNGDDYLGSGEPVFNSRDQIINWPLSRLVASHNQLVRDGYAFVGYHGTSLSSARSIVLDGVRTREQQLDPIWRGLYIAGDPSVAYGYAVNQNGRAGTMLRVYVPSSTLVGFFRTDMSLAAPRAPAEIARLIGHPLPLVLNSITGPEEDGGSLETILGWPLAERTVVIPSAIQVDDPSGGLAPSTIPEEEKAISSLPDYATQPR
ncbi:hypothetical protein [Pseudomonas chlororaphis]|uniref:hypothetical protein n=1 Tax=Pseudomonas chlororaphis TaxID=587753 RepID=UPI000F6C34CF|nr:hypothetical protein [Pseudomonas chlororaphis]AZD55049.1 exotoxin A precursor [Pseudomonas chlororaphis subsp. aurantiaca]AZD73609.1 exotoxin A precursor [Pseudomonas chlororaphis subsp. aurantiaca]